MWPGVVPERRPREGASGTAETKTRESFVKIIVVAAVIVAVAVWAGVYFAGGTKALPTGEAAGVQLPPRSVPSSATPVNPYTERAKQRPPKAEETPPGGGQSWGN